MAASIGEPPPSAMIVSGLNARISSAPRSTVVMVGSGFDVVDDLQGDLLGAAMQHSVIRSTKPSRVIVASVTT